MPNDMGTYRLEKFLQEKCGIEKHIPASPEVHANNADEECLRVGDKSKKLSFQDRTQLMYDKGMRYFEDSLVADAEI